jgi:hypothetical protein
MHKPRELIALWPHDEMPVVRHHAIREQAYSGPSDRESQNVLECRVIRLGEEQTFAPYSSIQDVKDMTVTVMKMAATHGAGTAIELPRHSLAE